MSREPARTRVKKVSAGNPERVRGGGASGLEALTLRGITGASAGARHVGPRLGARRGCRRKPGPIVLRPPKAAALGLGVLENGHYDRDCGGCRAGIGRAILIGMIVPRDYAPRPETGSGGNGGSRSPSKTAITSKTIRPSLARKDWSLTSARPGRPAQAAQAAGVAITPHFRYTVTRFGRLATARIEANRVPTTFRGGAICF